MKKKLAAKSEDVKRPQVTVFVGYPLLDELERAAGEEPVRSVAALLELVRYAWPVYQRVGSLKELKRLQGARAQAEHSHSKRISRETQEQLFTALRTIFDTAPSAVIEEIAGILTARAGKYGIKP